MLGKRHFEIRYSFASCLQNCPEIRELAGNSPDNSWRPTELPQPTRGAFRATHAPNGPRSSPGAPGVTFRDVWRAGTAGSLHVVCHKNSTCTTPLPLATRRASGVAEPQGLADTRPRCLRHGLRVRAHVSGQDGPPRRHLRRAEQPRRVQHVEGQAEQRSQRRLRGLGTRDTNRR